MYLLKVMISHGNMFTKGLDVSVERCLVQHAVLAHLGVHGGLKWRCQPLFWEMYTYNIYMYKYMYVNHCKSRCMSVYCVC